MSAGGKSPAALLKPGRPLVLAQVADGAEGLVLADLARAIADAGGLLDAIDLVRVEAGSKVRDVSVLATDSAHADAIVAACRAVPGVTVENVSDRTFLLHLGGKIHMASNAPVKTRDDLSMAYTPGVARVCEAIAADPERAWNLTIKRNTVAVVTDGSAVLGLGDIGPAAGIHGGHVVAEGTPEQVSASTDPFVRQFVDGASDGPVPFHYPASPYRGEMFARVQ